jgi:hypothetical protein
LESTVRAERCGIGELRRIRHPVHCPALVHPNAPSLCRAPRLLAESGICPACETVGLYTYRHDPAIVDISDIARVQHIGELPSTASADRGPDPSVGLFDAGPTITSCVVLPA